LTGYLRGQLQTFRHHAASSGETRHVERLHAIALEAFGQADKITLMLECALEEIRSNERTVTASAAAWQALEDRAGVLGEDDPTLMRIRAFRVRFVRLRGGGRGDTDRGVAGYYAEWQRRLGVLGPDHYRTSVARANLAVALRERCRDSDLDQACEILREEVERRGRIFGADDPFTSSAELVLAQTLVRVTEVDGDVSCAEAAREILSRLVVARFLRYGMADVATLRAQLVHAHAMLVLGQTSAALSGISHVRQLCQRVRAILTPGWPEFLLARAQVADGMAKDRALGAAQEALRLRRAYFSPGSREVVDAQQLVDELSQS
jgi:hypothetical protein